MLGWCIEKRSGAGERDFKRVEGYEVACILTRPGAAVGGAAF